jgi:hypothetical protein
MASIIFLTCAFLPDWVGTTPAFTISRSSTGGCDLRFQHTGLGPQLGRYDMCRAGWDQYLPSLRDYIQKPPRHSASYAVIMPASSQNTTERHTGNKRST